MASVEILTHWHSIHTHTHTHTHSQLIRELKEEVAKLRVVIKAEGLEAKVASFSMYSVQ